ncbi:hypothetical protein M433DRAFT_151490 [Acidomyces richmondensis BFW]|nr:MAG: hypothetical protein FE78DRAFT_85411 [Acidomyces sp. 'richmondensis']KYG48063.1 hypothetical protein M433DRAFT_151490 [Acidomyces richmondensis BFW]
MPLLLRRRSLLDLLNASADKQALPRPGSNGSVLNTDSSLGSPRPVSEYGYSTSRLSHELRPGEVSEGERSVPETRRANRFSLLKMRNFSESQLAARAHMEGVKEDIPPLPNVPSGDVVPSIVKTAPTMDDQCQEEETARKVRPSLFRRSMSKNRNSDDTPSKSRKSSEQTRAEKSKGSSLRWRRLQGRSSGLEDLARLSAMHAHQNFHSAPPSYGDESNSALALPVPAPRFSESSQSDGSNGSSGDHIYGQTTTTTHTVSTHTTFFKLPRRNKNRNSLFPPPVKLQPPEEQLLQANEPSTPRASTSGYSTRSMRTPGSKDTSTPPPTILQRRYTETSPTKQRHPPSEPSPNAALAAKNSLSFPDPGSNLLRNGSQRSHSSSTSSPIQMPRRLGLRDRASTASSFERGSQDMDTPPPLTGSARNSTSTAGRSSLGGFLTLARFRQSSEPHSPRHGSPGTRSKSNSFAMSREALVIPEREEGDTPGKYLERLEAAVARSMIAGILSKSADPFAQAVLRSYTRRFPFFGEPIDMSLRKFLLEAELPKETQQVDRVIQAFADRYHECNPGIFVSPDQAYIIAFSLMMLHTDAFNKNNKRKMQKQDYIKNTSGQHVAEEVLACFYDNICYTPFIHFEEEFDINGERVIPFKPKKSKLKSAMNDASGKKSSGPVDPYNLLVEQRLDVLRPMIKDSMTLDDPYHYRGSQSELDPQYLQSAFTHTGILQIISARSRPTAYEGQLANGNSNPLDTEAGIIDLKITKVGTLWRKATKKKKARSPWQEWGAILTGSQLYLFKNAHWAKTLLHQFIAQQKPGHPRTPVIFKPPLHEFKPDALLKTDTAVALVDSSYNRHKHAFTFFRAGGHEEVLLADSEADRNDWMALINYAAAFRAAGVRIRGMVGGNEEDLRRRETARLDATSSTQSLQSPSGEVTVMRGGLSPQLQKQVMAARRQIIVQKISETEKEIAEANARVEEMLRNARHLLLLAPIAPKTREDIIHAAARTDAMIKWLRRDVWRRKCHRDILAMDVQQDGVSLAELQLMTSQQAAISVSAKKEKAPGLLRLGSRASALPARSPPQSPTSPTRSAMFDRRSTADSIEAIIGSDIFKTPSESTMEQKQGDYWSLPPLQLDVQKGDRHRPSFSTHLSVTSQSRGALSHTSSTSSILQNEHPESPKSFDEETHMNKTARPSMDEREVELLARSSVAPPSSTSSAPRGMSLDGAPPTSTPDSKHKGVRRSLHKTLRDAQHGPTSIYRHRRNKESDGTLRMGDAKTEEAAEGTPGLQREKGRFILHGKQASVVQFGAEWPNERMKLRRETWRQRGASPRDDQHNARRGSEAESQRSIVNTPSTTREMRLGGDVTSSDGASEGTGDLRYLREDAEAADAFAMSSGSVRASSSGTSDGGDAVPRFDLPQWDPETKKRQTVIGPQPQAKESSQNVEDDAVESDVEDFSLGSRENRITVIGPSSTMHVNTNPGAETSIHDQGVSAGSAKGGAEEDENEEVDPEDDSMIVAPIGDDELRRISQQAVAVA